MKQIEVSSVLRCLVRGRKAVLAAAILLLAAACLAGCGPGPGRVAANGPAL